MANHLEDAIEILIMAFALGMDAFSLAIGIGLKGISRRRALFLCVLIGLFHVGLTFFGLYAGMLLQDVLGQLAKWLGSFLLFGLGLHMLYASFFGKEEDVSFNTTVPGMLLFALSVSVDSLSVGFSIGLRSTAFGIVSALTFGIAAALMTGIGLFVGKRFNRIAGKMGEVLGAVILLGYGAHFLFS